MTSRYFCFTIFNYIDPKEDLVESYEEQNRSKKAGNFKINYSCWQEEKCPDTGRSHIQGYVQLDRPCRFTALKKLEGISEFIGDGTWETAHFEPAKGSQEQNERYCGKLDSRISGPFSFGTGNGVGQGSRSDLTEVVQLIAEGKTIRDVAIQCPETFIKFHRGIENYERLVNERKRERQTKWILFYGDPGSGKSMAALHLSRELSNQEPFYFSPSNGATWWDGYNGEEVVIFDDCYGQLPYNLLLRLGDSTPLKLQIKGGSVSFLAKYCIFTANSHFDNWYRYDSSYNFNLGAVDRRFFKIVRYSGMYPNARTELERDKLVEPDGGLQRIGGVDAGGGNATVIEETNGEPGLQLSP